MQAEQNITSSSSSKPQAAGSPPNKSPMQSLSLEQIERLLDDIKLEPQPSNENERMNIQKDEGFPSDETQEQEPDPDENVQKEQLNMEDVTINRSEIIFGNPGLVPGAIEEIDFSVSLNFRQNEQNLGPQHEFSSHILRIIAVCKNEEFDTLDEYVFSVRSNNCYDYFEEIRFKIKRGERADIKIAVKIPQLKKNYAINGIVEVRLQNLQPIYVPIVAKCVIPEIICLKELYKQDEGVSLIKIPAKKCQQRTPPIPFKNISPFNLTFEVQAISNESYEHKPYDIVVQNFVGCQPNAQFFVNMQLRQNVNYTGIYPTRAFIRKILTIKIKNSSMVYYFPIEVSVFEGQALEGN